VVPLVVDQIKILIRRSQHYSFVLTANQPIDNYWVRALPNIGPPNFDNRDNSAILRYLGAPDEDPTTVEDVSNPMIETNLHPLTNLAAPGIPIPGAADVNLPYEITFNGTAFTVNNATFTPPAIPVLLQIISGSPRNTSPWIHIPPTDQQSN
jgi:iron transport multicopper oxidase